MVANASSRSMKLSSSLAQVLKSSAKLATFGRTAGGSESMAAV